MKRSYVIFVFLLPAILVALGSCVSMDQVAREVGNLITDAQGESSSSGGSDTAPEGDSDQPARTEEKASEDSLVGQMMMDVSGMTAMQDYMVAMMVYANAFYAGGFAYGYDQFQEGEGVIWRVVSSDGASDSELYVERALLKNERDGAWWLLTYESEGERFVSEALIGSDYELLVFRYEDPDRKEIREWRAEMADNPDDTIEKDQVESTVDESQPEFFAGDYRDYRVGTETTTVAAGRFTAEHIRIDETYESGSVSYEWWISEDVPGWLVKYLWRDSAEEASVTGELIEIRDDYATRLNSY